MKKLVIGGSGFIESNLSRQMLHDGHDVRVFDSLLSGYKVNLTGLDLELIEGDVR